MKLVIDKEGNVCGVYNDILRDLNLGTMDVSRASAVEFDSKKQQWVANIFHGKIKISHPNRQQLLTLERDVVESRLIDKLTK